MTRKYNVPKFDGSNYKRWKLLVDLWENVTEIDEEKRGAALILNMTDSALDIALAIDPTKLKKVKDLTKIMDKVYVDDNDLSMKCDEFDRMLRKPEQSMKEFIHLYEQKVNELKTGNVNIPDIVLATKILRAANLVPNHYLIARSSCTEMTFDMAKAALLRVSEKCPGTKHVGSHGLDKIKVKEEVLDYEEQAATLFNEADVNLHNTFYGHHNEEDVYYQGTGSNRPRRTQFIQNRNASTSRRCFNCGESGHGFRDCPHGVSRGRNTNRQCYGCGDTSHWIKDCPHMRDLHNLVRSLSQQSSKHNNYPNGKFQSFREKQSNQKTYLVEDQNDVFQGEVNYTEEEMITGKEKPVLFLQSDVGNEVEDILLVGETVNKAVLDSGASKTVCGLEWYKCYLDSLDDELRKDLKEYTSDTIFRFGVGKLKAMKMAHLPVMFCGEKMKLEVHVVDTDIPLLLSLKTMKTMGLQINFETDKVFLNGQGFDLETTSTGHYTLTLAKNTECNPEVYLNSVTECVKNPKLDIKKKAMKLHRRFAHASSNRIIELLRNAGKSDKELEQELENLQNSCDFCLKHHRSSPRPTVCLPLASEFNELIAMDLKQIDGQWVLHCIDYLTRFSAAHAVKGKDPDEIIDKFFTIWISMFGPPQRVFSDNGGEFQGEKWESFCEIFNISQKTTAAESPFSNGICERHNLLVAEMTEKIMEDVGCTLNVALMWAIHAKNSLINIHGFSPYQLVFGRNPNSPGNSHNKLPALTSETASQVVADHLNSLREARHAYIKAESSNRIARALRGKVFEGTHKRFCVGDTVYYKRLNKKIWQGPGKVIAQDRNHVLVKSTAGRLVKVHPCKLVLKHEADSKIGMSTDEYILPNKSIETQRAMVDLSEESSESESESDKDDKTTPCSNTVVLDSDHDVPNVNCEENKENDKGSHVIETYEEILEEQSNPKKKLDKGKLKKGDKIFYKFPEKDEDWIVARIVSRGGKKGGKWEHFWNVKNLRSGNEISLNLNEVDWIKEDGASAEISYVTDQIAWETMVLNYENKKSDDHLLAKQTEIEKWKKFNVYEEVKRSDYPNQELISCRWVNETKEAKGNEIPQPKFRLVARGFQEVEPPISDSPTAQKSVTRMCLALSNLFGWKVEGLDIRAAFLQSNDIDRVVLMTPPKEFRVDDDVVWRIKKPIYGLNDGARKWFITMKKKLVEYGCKPLTLDPSVYVYHERGLMCGFCVLHVDDFLIGGIPLFHEKVVSKLVSEFVVSTRKSGQFTYVGWDINQTKNYIEVDQMKYQLGISMIELNTARSKQTEHECSLTEKRSYQQLLGRLQWISSQSRPDIRFAVLECSLMASKPKVKDIIRINKVVKKMNKTTLKIRFGISSCKILELKILAYSDASLSNLPDKTSSTRSFVIFLWGNGKVAPLSWCSKKLERVAKTIIYAEGIALGRCLDEAVNLRQAMLQALNVPERTKDGEYTYLPIIGITDSKSLWDNIHSSSQADDLKLRREVASIREQIELKEVAEVRWAPTHLQLADCLTKNQASPETLIRVLTSGDLPM